jgi:hypothetical protein
MCRYGFKALGDDNYPTWHIQMWGVLATKDCIDAIDDAASPNSNKAKGLIAQCVKQQHLGTVARAANAMELWTTLQGLFQQRSTANKLKLITSRKELSVLA